MVEKKKKKKKTGLSPSKLHNQQGKIRPTNVEGKYEPNEEVMEYYLSNANHPQSLQPENKSSPDGSTVEIKTNKTMIQKLINLKNKSFNILSRGQTKKNLHIPHNSVSEEVKEPPQQKESRARRLFRQLSSFGRSGSRDKIETSSECVINFSKLKSSKISPTEMEEEPTGGAGGADNIIPFSSPPLSPEQRPPGKSKASKITYAKWITSEKDKAEANQRKAISDLLIDQEQKEREEDIHRLKRMLQTSRREGVSVKGAKDISDKKCISDMVGSLHPTEIDCVSDDVSDLEDEDEDAALYKPVGIF